MTLKSYFMLHNAHFLSFHIYLFPVAVQYHYFPPRMKENEMMTIKEEKESKETEPVPTFLPVLDSSENSVTLSIILN